MVGTWGLKNMSIKHKHDKLGNKKIKKAITVAALTYGIPRNAFHNGFVFEHDYNITEIFWEVLWNEFPETRVFDKVGFCQSCKAFYFDDLMYGNSNSSH